MHSCMQGDKTNGNLPFYSWASDYVWEKSQAVFSHELLHLTLSTASLKVLHISET